MKEHTPVKFSCQYCDSTEGNQESLQCHMIKAHNEIAILCNMAKRVDKLTDNFASFENFKSELSSVLKSLFDNQHILKQEMFLIRNNQPKQQARYPTTETEVKQRKRATEDDDISPSMPAPPAGPPVPPPRTMSSSSTNVSRAPPPARNTEPTAEQSSPSCPPQSSPPSPSACALEVVTQCDECSFQDIRKENILNHRIAKHSCDKCDFVTRQKSELNRHKLSVDGKQSISQYQCDLCSFADVNEENVLNHKIAKHLVHLCEMCDFECWEEKKLENHYQSIHKQTKYSCNICESSLKTHSNLKSTKQHNITPKSTHVITADIKLPVLVICTVQPIVQTADPKKSKAPPPRSEYQSGICIC